MNEQEWLLATDPRPLIGFAKNSFDKRKARLFASACCRHISSLLSDNYVRRAIEIAERFADGTASDDERAETWSEVNKRVDSSQRSRDFGWSADNAVHLLLMGDFADITWFKAAAMVSREVAHAAPTSVPTQLALFRDIFANPFRPVSFDPRWRTADTLGVARGIYEDRAFERMPILADALMDAGCDEAAILDHCRGPGPHVRGCWVVDLVLDKQ